MFLLWKRRATVWSLCLCPSFSLISCLRTFESSVCRPGLMFGSEPTTTTTRRFVCTSEMYEGVTFKAYQKFSGESLLCSAIILLFHHSFSQMGSSPAGLTFPMCFFPPLCDLWANDARAGLGHHRSRSSYMNCKHICLTHIFLC